VPGISITLLYMIAPRPNKHHISKQIDQEYKELYIVA
jgi:hypothetical protein